jgi:methionine biosynthesis protein MetW
MKTEFKIISDLIDKNSHVLDVGCGDGILMEFLIKEKKVNIRGIEISKAKVQNCIAKGLTIIEGNAEDDLRQFPNKSFDFVILSQTLQAFLNPEKVIDELLRIGKQAIVTIPNFGYWKIGLHLLLKGTMPITRTLPDEWYNTANIHLCTIKDFVNFSRSKNFNLSKSIALKSNQQSLITNSNLNIKNLSSNLGIFLIKS